MRLAILGTRGIPARYGGFETFAEELSVRLVEKGVDVTVYCEAGTEVANEIYRGVHLVHIPAPSLGPLTTILFDLLCLWHARKMFDVVYMLGYGTSIFCFIPRIWGTRVWINMDGVEWARTKWGTLAKLWFKCMEAAAMWTPDRVIADAKGILEHLKSRHYHLPPVSVIAYGAPVIDDPPDTGLLDEWQLSSGRYHLVVCRIEPENSVKEIVEGYLESESAFPLIIVGSIDPVTDYVKELLKMNDSRIRFIGPVYDKVKLQALRFHSSAYLHGHTVGGTNPSLLEALGCGNKIIAHNNVFNREVAGEAATYFHTGGEIAESIMAVESCEPDALYRRESLARQRIRTRYKWEDIADTYLMTLNSEFYPATRFTGIAIIKPEITSEIGIVPSSNHMYDRRSAP
jgi:glycosyltransferase involved in cell wall biosynthesis